MRKPKDDLTGRKFGKLTVIEFVGRNEQSTPLWRCLCDCGKEKVTHGCRLKNGSCLSCGCLKGRNKKNGTGIRNGNSSSRLCKEWYQMIFRTRNKTWSGAKRYYERGITVCQEWKNSYEAFEKWALSNGYADNLSLDRIDNDKGYSPDNCRWADSITQNRNKWNSLYLEYKGKRKHFLEWAKIYNINPSTLYTRLHGLNWNIKDALEKPVRHKA